MIAFVEAHRAELGVELICRELPIAPPTFYDRLVRRADPDLLSDRAKRDAELRPETERVFEANWRVYRSHDISCARVLKSDKGPGNFRGTFYFVDWLCFLDMSAVSRELGAKLQLLVEQIWLSSSYLRGIK